MMTKERVEELLWRLHQIATHDWRKSFLAHTSDTAAEAGRTIVALYEREERLEAEIIKLKKEISELRDDER